MGIFKKNERYLGIDISASAVKLIDLGRDGKGFKVNGFAIEPLPEGAVTDQNPTEVEQVGAVIKRALKMSGSDLKIAAVAVPTSSVITRSIPMPVEFGPDEVEANVQVEASQYIPFPLDDIYLDFQIVGESKDSDGSQDVIVVASRKENVDLRESALDEAGLKTAIVDVESYSLENTFHLLVSNTPDLNPAGRIGLVDMGANVSTLYVFEAGEIVFTREQQFGGEQLTVAIADNYGLSREQAELAKRSGELSEDYPETTLMPYRQNAAAQIRQALQFFYSANDYASLDHMFITGGGALIDGLAEEVTSQLEIPASLGSPFEGMSTARKVNRRSLMRDGPMFAVACGLALRSFD